MASAPSIRTARLQRERDIVDATRALFDERGLQDAPIEEIAKAVGINKALIYRHFSSKEELFVLTVTHYLAELAGRMRPAVETDDDPRAQFERVSRVYTGFCLEYPAFLDCALSLMRRPFRELQESVSEAVYLRLGQAMAECLSVTAGVLARGTEQGVFAVDDPDFTANHLYTQALGTMHLARLGIGVRRVTPGIPAVFTIDPADVQEAAIADALRAVSPAARPA